MEGTFVKSFDQRHLTLAGYLDGSPLCKHPFDRRL